MTAALWIMASKRGPACELHCLSYVLTVSDKHVTPYLQVDQAAKDKASQAASKVDNATGKVADKLDNATDKAADDAGGAADAVRTAAYSLNPSRPLLQVALI